MEDAFDDDNDYYGYPAPYGYAPGYQGVPYGRMPYMPPQPYYGGYGYAPWPAQPAAPVAPVPLQRPPAAVQPQPEIAPKFRQPAAPASANTATPATSQANKQP